jgi:hypothetical protein
MTVEHPARIRTRGGLLTHTRFPGVRLKPLIHPSAGKPGILARNERSACGGAHAIGGQPALAERFITAMALATRADTSLMLPGTIIVLFFCASCP